MKIIRSAPELERTVRGWNSRSPKPRVGFVPTMGALHEGHRALVRRARRANAIVVVSIFVNPLQFGPGEDYARYPRTESADMRLLRNAGADVVFIPAPRPFLRHKLLKKTFLPPLAAPLCGRFRPGHFQGVVNIVAFLFRLVRPDRAYFGQKDYQQVRVVAEMTRRVFGARPRIVLCPTVREPDGLAMSSRNRYLTPEERRRALGLIKALRRGARALRRGQRTPAVLRGLRDRLQREGISQIDYVAAVDGKSLKNVVKWSPRRPLLLAAAVKIGKTRLIDNLLIK